MSVRHHLYQPHQAGGRFPPQLARPCEIGAPQTVGGGGGGGFSPSDLGAALLSWHDASNAGSLSLTGSLVDQWSDLSGNGHNLLDAIAKPTYVTSAVNGLNAILFDDATTTLLRSATTPVTAAGFYAWVAGETNDDAAARIFIFFGQAASNSDYFAAATNSVEGKPITIYTRSLSAGLATASTPNGYTVNVPFVARAAFLLATDRRISLDGGTEGTNGTNVTPSGVDRFSIGAIDRAAPAAFFSGYICEVVVADSALLSAADIANVDAYMTRWQP